MNTNEKLVVKPRRRDIMLDQCWPIAAVMLVMLVIALIALGFTLHTLLLMSVSCLLVVLCTLVMLFPRSRAEYTFYPANQYRSTRLMVAQGSQEMEVYDVPPQDFVFAQSWVEKLLGVHHMRIKHTTMYLRGIREVEDVKAWVAANFRERPVRTGKKGKKGRK